MKNRVVILAKNRSVYGEIENAMIKRGLLDFSYQISADLNECFYDAKLAKLNAENAIVICKNEYVDQVLEQVTQNGDEVSLIFDQAVKIVDHTKTKKMLILPLELDKERFFDAFLESQEVHVCSVFGKTVSFIEEKFKQFDCNFKILSKSIFLHTVYYSRQIEESVLKAALEDGLYSLSDESLAAACGRKIKEKDISIAFVEEVTGGIVAAKFIMESDVKLNNCHILLVDNEFRGFGLSDEILQEKGIVSKEAVYELSKRLLEKSKSEIALSVVGDKESSGRTFIAVGNKETIHVYSSVLQGSKAEIMENISDFAFFRLLRFLEEKY